MNCQWDSYKKAKSTVVDYLSFEELTVSDDWFMSDLIFSKASACTLKLLSHLHEPLIDPTIKLFQTLK